MKKFKWYYIFAFIYVAILIAIALVSLALVVTNILYISDFYWCYVPDELLDLLHGLFVLVIIYCIPCSLLFNKFLK